MHQPQCALAIIIALTVAALFIVMQRPLGVTQHKFKAYLHVRQRNELGNVHEGPVPDRALSLSSTTLKYFPQAQRCPTRWVEEYVQLQHNMQEGIAPRRYFVSVAVEAGLADRLTGLITHFWHSVLTGRVFKTVSYGSVPAFAAICDAALVNWTSPPEGLPEEAIEPLKFTYKGVRGFPGNRRYLPSNLNPASFQMLYLVNGPPRNLSIYDSGNLNNILQPDPEYLLAASNRGRTFALAHNPIHKQQFWQYGISPADVFMCGFFTLCAPAAPVQQYYSRYWEILQEPGVLKIGIQIRIGDKVFKQEEQEQPAEEALKHVAEWFECAERLERAYAGPGQKVLWYLNSDSQQVRKAAKLVYGNKLITDVELKMTHPDCHQDRRRDSNTSTQCQKTAMDEAFQHSLGAMLTFSMTDYHIVSIGSGFGRLGAWLSGRWGNVYQIQRGRGSCEPGRFAPPELTFNHSAGV